MKLFGRASAVVVMVTVVMVMQETMAARILIAQPIGTRSMKNLYMAIAESLAERNHTVTLVTGFKSSHRRTDIREVFVPDMNVFNNMTNLFNTSFFASLMDISPEMHTYCTKALGSKELQGIKDEDFDLVMIQSFITECFLSIVHRLKVPFIYVTPNEVLGAQSALTGTPGFPSLMPNFMFDFTFPLTFTERMISTLYDVLTILEYDWITVPKTESLCRTLNLCPEDMPSLEILIRNASLTIANSVKTMENPIIPYTPTVVHVGGIHCHPARPLPEDLDDWVAGAEHGFIYFSLGSFVKTSEMPDKYRNVLLEVFGSLQQRVLWKWDDDTIEGLPPNVRLSKWLPQQDILGHPHLRLFITHGGQFSTLEALYHGVPIVGIPVNIDQHYNMRRVEKDGWGRVLYWEDLTYETLRSYVLEIMEDTGMRGEVQRLSRIMRDQPMSPRDWTTYWVEYVLRHQGATHLRSPVVQIPWYELYNVDVWALVVVVTVAVASLSLYVSYKILRALIGCCRGAKKTKQE